MKTIGELMTPDPITLTPEDAVLDCLGVFEENRIHHIPVVDLEGEIVGMVSSKDFENFVNISRVMAAHDRPVTVGDIMTSPIFSYFSTVTAKKAAGAMVDNNIHAIVVVDEDEKLAGILTATDLLRYLSVVEA